MYIVNEAFLQYAIGQEISDEDIKKYPNWLQFCEKQKKKVVEVKTEVVADKPKKKKTKKSKK